MWCRICLFFLFLVLTGNASTLLFDTYQQRPADFGQSRSRVSISSSRSFTSRYSSEQMCVWKFLSSSISKILARIASATFFKVSCWSGLGQNQLDRRMRQYMLLHAREYDRGYMRVSHLSFNLFILLYGDIKVLISALSTRDKSTHAFNDDVYVSFPRRHWRSLLQSAAKVSRKNFTSACQIIR